MQNIILFHLPVFNDLPYSSKINTHFNYNKGDYNFDQLSLSKLKKLALILNDIYSSWDIVLRALMAHDDKAQSDLAKKYIAFHPFSTET